MLKSSTLRVLDNPYLFVYPTYLSARFGVVVLGGLHRLALLVGHAAAALLVVDGQPLFLFQFLNELHCLAVTHFHNLSSF